MDPPHSQVSDLSSAVREDVSHITPDQSVILESGIEGSKEVSPEGGIHAETLPSVDSDDINFPLRIVQCFNPERLYLLIARCILI